jgi:hypothetical protein
MAESYFCYGCGNSFYKYVEYQEHWEKEKCGPKDFNEINFSCKPHDNFFSSQQALDKHNHLEHSPIKCIKCGITHSDKVKFDEHLKNCINDKSASLANVVCKTCGVSVNAQHTCQGATKTIPTMEMVKLLSTGSENHALELIKKINASDIDALPSQTDGKTLLTHATIYRCQQVVEYLLSKGADPEYMNAYDNCYTPIDYAKCYSTVTILRLLENELQRRNQKDQSKTQVKKYTAEDEEDETDKILQIMR